jgi:hypothetical protein
VGGRWSGTEASNRKQPQRDNNVARLHHNMILDATRLRVERDCLSSLLCGDDVLDLVARSDREVLDQILHPDGRQRLRSKLI